MTQQNQEVKNGNVRKTPIFIALAIALAVITLAGITSFLRSERQQGSDFTFQFESGQHGQRMVQYLASQPSPPAAMQAPNFSILPALLKTSEDESSKFSSDLSFPQSYQQYLNTLAATQNSTKIEHQTTSKPQFNAEAQLAQTLQQQRISQLIQALSASAGVDQPFANPHKALRTNTAYNNTQEPATYNAPYNPTANQGTYNAAHSVAYMDYPNAKAQLAVLEQMDAINYNVAPSSSRYVGQSANRPWASSTYPPTDAYTPPNLVNGSGMNNSTMTSNAAVQFNYGISSTQTLQAYKSLNQKHRPLQSALEPVLSPFLLRQGVVLPCVLLSGINSDLPGMIQAQVTQDVYDSPQGSHLLIPKGSKIIGQYAASPKLGQQRLMLAFNRIIFPDGTAMGLGAMPGSGLDGYAGFDAEVDNHFWQLMSNAILLGGITAGISISVDEPRDDNGDLTLNGALSQGLGQSMGRVLTQVIERNMAISPTLKVQPGLEFNVTLTQDIYFDHPYGM